MENPVLASPEHKFYAGAEFSKGKWNWSSGLQYVAGLYTELETDITENFVLWNINGSYRVVEWLSLYLKGENILAQRYEIMKGYPMPKATFMGGININF